MRRLPKILRVCLFSACGLLPAAWAIAQWRPAAPAVQVPAQVQQAIVRIECCDGQGCTLGSGTLVERWPQAGIVLTCAHLFERGAARITVRTATRAFQGQLIDIEPALDLAAVVIHAPPMAAVPLATADVRRGDAVASLGLAGDGVLRINQGQALGYLTPMFGRVRGPEGATLEISGTASQGDSGGPFLNDRWELCGVLASRARSGYTCGTCLPRVRAFLERVRAKLGRGNAPPPQPVAPPPQLSPPQITNPPADAEQQPPPANPPEVPQGNLPPRDFAAELARQQAAFDAQRARLEAEIARLKIQAQAAPMPAPQAEPPNFTPPVQFEGELERRARAAGTALVTKLMLAMGLSPPIAAIGAAGLTWFVMRRARKRLEARLGQRGGPPAMGTSGGLQFQPVPTTDHEYQHLLEAISREAKYNPPSAAILDRVLNTHAQLMGGQPRHEKLRSALGLGWKDPPKKES